MITPNGEHAWYGERANANEDEERERQRRDLGAQFGGDVLGRVAGAGTEVELVRYDGLVHGFVDMGEYALHDLIRAVPDLDAEGRAAILGGNAVALLRLSSEHPALKGALARVASLAVERVDS